MGQSFPVAVPELPQVIPDCQGHVSIKKNFLSLNSFEKTCVKLTGHDQKLVFAPGGPSSDPGGVGFFRSVMSGVTHTS